MLEDLGHIVIEAPSGAAALDILTPHRRFDHHRSPMPRMSGTEFAREVHARLPSLPIVLATGYAELPAGSGGRLPRLAKPSPRPTFARHSRRR